MSPDPRRQGGDDPVKVFGIDNRRVPHELRSPEDAGKDEVLELLTEIEIFTRILHMRPSKAIDGSAQRHGGGLLSSTDWTFSGSDLTPPANWSKSLLLSQFSGASFEGAPLFFRRFMLNSQCEVLLLSPC